MDMAHVVSGSYRTPDNVPKAHFCNKSCADKYIVELVGKKR